MTPQDAPRFMGRLLTVAELFDIALSDRRAQAYYDLLSDLPLEVAELGLAAAAATCRFFPKPIEVREAATGDLETLTERGWQGLHTAARKAGAYSSLLVDDAALAATLVACFGSWPQFCAKDSSPEMWVADRKSFARVYRVNVADRLSGPRWLPGLTEQQNALHPDYQRFTSVSRVSLRGGVRTLTAAETDAARHEIAALAQREPTSLVETSGTWTPIGALEADPT